ncbi:hypothetical protein J6590_085510 [Homalodisca vitripennis]|nr:hypothetical protein J6590_085510 [Homalodisca vitripennis]
MFLRNGHLSFLELGTYFLRNLNLSLPYIYKVHRISINTRHKALYAIGEADALLYYLFSMNYDGSNMKKLYEGPELINPSGLGVVDNKVVWAAYNDTNDMNVLYMCYLSPICQANNITIIYESKEVIRDVKLYSPEVQMPDKEMLCLQLFCSHSCKITTPFIATCTCPDDLVLGPDNTTCLGGGRSTRSTTPPPLVLSLSFWNSLIRHDREEKPKPKKDPQDIGCYTISYSESRLYKVHHPLSWEECINLCNRRSSVYAGIQAEQGYPTYNFVFCGNDIKEHSTTANSSLCLPCMDDKTRLCGGQNTLSLYQLRESNPLVLYLATESGLKIFSTESLSTEALTGSSSPTTAGTEFAIDKEDREPSITHTERDQRLETKWGSARDEAFRDLPDVKRPYRLRAPRGTALGDGEVPEAEHDREEGFRKSSLARDQEFIEYENSQRQRDAEAGAS